VTSFGPTDALRSAQFVDADLRGARFVGADRFAVRDLDVIQRRSGG
jgi:hypothetical protein